VHALQITLLLFFFINQVTTQVKLYPEIYRLDIVALYEFSNIFIDCEPSRFFEYVIAIKGLTLHVVISSLQTPPPLDG
jgi:hypothetical protein